MRRRLLGVAVVACLMLLAGRSSAFDEEIPKEAAELVEMADKFVASKKFAEASPHFRRLHVM